MPDDRRTNPDDDVPAPELAAVLERWVEGGEDLPLEPFLEQDLEGLTPAQRRVVVEEALDRAETVQRPPTPTEAGDPVGRYDAGATDGREPDPRGWPGGATADREAESTAPARRR